MSTIDKECEMLDKYRYGDGNYFVIWPYDVDIEAQMGIVEKIVKEGHSFHINYNSYIYGTKPGWTVDLGEFQGTGPEMRDACYNALIKFVKNEQKESKEGGNI